MRILLILTLATVFTACAAKKPAQQQDAAPSAGIPQAEPQKPADPVPDNIRSKISEDETHDAQIVTGLLENGKLDHKFEGVRMSFASARVSLKSVPSKKPTGTLHVRLLKGDPAACKARTVLSPTRITIVDWMPSDQRCRFDVELILSQAVDLDLDVGAGAVDVSGWNQPVRIRTDLADVNVENVGALTVKGAQVTLSGSGVSGPLKWEFDHGNVGIEALSAGAEGKTSGDVVLKWTKMDPGSKVDVQTKHGDVALAIPKAVHVALDLKVPRGEVYVSLKEREFAMNSQELRSGHPVNVTAELGSVRILH